jgi:hypothetical protein
MAYRFLIPLCQIPTKAAPGKTSPQLRGRRRRSRAEQLNLQRGSSALRCGRAPQGEQRTQTCYTTNLLKEKGMKKKTEREKTAPVQNKDLAWVKGSSGYVIWTVVDGGPGDQPPPGGG